MSSSLAAPLTHYQQDFRIPPAALASSLSGQFAVFAFATGYAAVGQPDMSYNRRDLHKISLYTSGSAQILYAGRLLHVQAPALVLYNALVPYTCQQHEALAGYCCLFTTEFVSEARRGALAESPLFRLDAEPVFELSAEQATCFSQQFDQLLAAVPTDPRYLPEVLRTRVHLLVLEALRQRLDVPPPPLGGATVRLATQFLELLAQQFPVLAPSQALRLTTAHQFAERLHTHANHLNRAVREATGQPIRAHVAARLLQEAQTLLRFTDWSVGDIAHSLGFEAATSFQRFFRRHTRVTPSNFRCAVRQGVTERTSGEIHSQKSVRSDK